MTQDKRFPWEKVARLDSEERRSRQPPQGLVDLVVERAPATVLEIGVGTGYFALPAAARLPAATVIGLDVEPRMLELFVSRAREAGVGERIKTLEAAIDGDTEVALVDGSVDVALMANLYHELDRREAALAEVGRLLGAKGQLVLCDWDPEGSSDAGPPVDHRRPAPSVEAELRAAGFSEVGRREIYADFYTFVARR